MEKYICSACDYVYDPAVGDSTSGVLPNVSFEELPSDWICPVCGVTKEFFNPVS